MLITRSVVPNTPVSTLTGFGLAETVGVVVTAGPALGGATSELPWKSTLPRTQADEAQFFCIGSTVAFSA